MYKRDRGASPDFIRKMNAINEELAKAEKAIRDIWETVVVDDPRVENGSAVGEYWVTYGGNTEPVNGPHDHFPGFEYLMDTLFGGE